ncbi:MAG: hypothetical protein ACRDZO_02320 [Egibacteraceae bacterium]
MAARSGPTPASQALTEGAWVDEIPCWVRGVDELFAQLLEVTPWRPYPHLLSPASHVE